MSALLAIAAWLLAVAWIMPRRTDYQPGRPINDLADMVYELQRVSVFTRNLIKFRGVFTPESAAMMSPSAAALDCYIIQDAAAGTTRAYLQITTKPRLRAWWSVTLEAA